MAKRRQVAETTTDDGRFSSARENEGGPDQTVEPARMASSEQLKERLIKQPKSRFPSAGSVPFPPVPQPTFAFGKTTSNTLDIAPALASNGSSGQPFGVPMTPAPTGFSTLNGTPATPTQQSPTKTNPFASLSTYTPEGKPLSSLFSASTTPAGMPAPPVAGLTPAGMPQFNSGSSVAKGWTPTTTSGFKPEFGFGSPAVTPSKPTGQNPVFTAPTFGSFTPKNDVANETGVTKLTSPGLSGFNGGHKDDVMNSQDTRDNGSNFPNPFSGFFSPKQLTPASASLETSISVPDTAVVSAAVAEKDFKVGEQKNVGSEISRERQNQPALESPRARNIDPFQSPRPTLDSLSGSDTSVNVNGLSSASEDVTYPSLPPAPSTPASSTSTTNGISARDSPAPMAITFEVPPPPENFTSAQQAEWDRKYKIQVLNSTLLKFLQNSDPAGDWRGVFAVHAKLFEEITRGTKRKGELQHDAAEHGSPKRSKTDHEKPAVSSAAKVLGDIVDKSVGPFTSPAFMKQNEPLKPSSNIFNSQPFQASTAEKPASPVGSVSGGNIFTAHTSPTTTPTNATNNSGKVISNIFGPGGGAAIGAPPAPANRLFSNLQPTLSATKDKGEEDSPDKHKTGGIFGAESTTIPPAPRFVFGAPSTVATPEKPIPSGLFSNTPSDQTWKPNSPIRFGGPSTSTASSNMFTSPNNSLGPFVSSTFNTAPSTSATTASTTTDAPKPYSFGSNSSLAPSFEGAGSGVFTPGATSSDLESKAEGSSSGNGNEPSDDVHSEKVDLSGPGPGEENDTVICSARVAVYVKDDKGKMKKVAVGASRVLKDKSSGVVRFLVRTEQGKVAVNVRLQKQIQYTALPDRKIILIPDFSGDKPKLYTVRTKESEEVNELGRCIVNALD